MKTFSELGIKPVNNSYVGDKIRIDKLIDKPIVVEKFKIQASKFEKGHGKCLYMRIKLNEEEHVVFSSSVGLMDILTMIKESDFPFQATITKNNGRLIFK